MEAIDGIDSFLKSQLVIDAVTRNFEIIGEASNKVPGEIRDRYPELPSRQIMVYATWRLMSIKR